MAIVLYDADKAKASLDGMLPTGDYDLGGGSSSQVGGSTKDIEKARQKIKDLQEGKRRSKYLGLSN